MTFTYRLPVPAGRREVIRLVALRGDHTTGAYRVYYTLPYRGAREEKKWNGYICKMSLAKYRYPILKESTVSQNELFPSALHEAPFSNNPRLFVSNDVFPWPISTRAIVQWQSRYCWWPPRSRFDLDTLKRAGRYLMEVSGIKRLRGCKPDISSMKSLLAYRWKIEGNY